ncbi:hypothetical protein [Mesorhizobium escarrei]|uniref:Uncharacterized protein n=1 Tax=Mesorhizobium escarrei TaxID=666018 RepID=A0ABM9DRW3_9HYPH|nr:hypothetical protein [Mesorhizobium escarrei]CAH2399428.1 hypothetical protein MES5069_220158 [Mesorhizobium escarrei]
MTVRVKLKGGAEHFIRVDKAFGHPEKPASLADGVQKPKACAEMSVIPLSDKQLGLTGDFINHLDKQPTLSTLHHLPWSD